MRKVKGLIFDLDGVLVDTAKYHYAAWKRLSDELGIPFNEKDNERLKGVSRMESLETLLGIGSITMDSAQKEAMCERKNGWYLEYICNLRPDELFPGVRKFLLNARESGYRTALGSASKNCGLILDGLGITTFLDAVVDGTMIINAKPNPEVFLKGAELLGLQAEECLVFEDAESGIEAARRGNMLSVGIGSAEYLSKANIVIENFENVTADELVEQLAKTAV